MKRLQYAKDTYNDFLLFLEIIFLILDIFLGLFLECIKNISQVSNFKCIFKWVGSGREVLAYVLSG